MPGATVAEKDEEFATRHVLVRPSTWRDLNARKGPGMSFDDVIAELLGIAGKEETKA